MSVLQATSSKPKSGPDYRLTPVKTINLPTAVLAIDAHSNNKHLVAACFDGGIYRIDVESGAYTLIGKHESYASGVQYLTGSGKVVSSGYDGKLRWFDSDSGKQIRVVEAHKFWSWKMRTSPDQKLIGTVTGQYLVGGYKYEPAAEHEPSVRVYSADTGELKWSLQHAPPVLSVAFSPDSRYLAAGNLMGEVRVWDMTSGKQCAAWTTPDFTCWGIIKSHCYIGGIFDMTFSPTGSELLVTGMGPMVDPMAGNGKQTWQRFAWRENPPRKISEIAESDAGHGLMEVVRNHPAVLIFIMAGRLAQGKWNTAIFDSTSGKLLGSHDAKMRVTDAVWLNGGNQLALSGASSQQRKKNGKCPDFGHVKLFKCETS